MFDEAIIPCVRGSALLVGQKVALKFDTGLCVYYMCLPFTVHTASIVSKSAPALPFVSRLVRALDDSDI